MGALMGQPNESGNRGEKDGPEAVSPQLVLENERLRILRCTAKAMANSPGGLRFVAGTRPWLDGLAGGVPHTPRQLRRVADASPPHAN